MIVTLIITIALLFVLIILTLLSMVKISGQISDNEKK